MYDAINHENENELETAKQKYFKSDPTAWYLPAFA